MLPGAVDSLLHIAEHIGRFITHSHQAGAGEEIAIHRNGDFLFAYVAGVAVAGVAVHSCHNLTLNVLLLQRLALPITFQHVEPQAVQLLHKFWPGCSRVDNTYGDRNFCCCCDTLAQCE